MPSGKKSKEELMTPVPSILPARPKPPAGLNATERKRWRALVNELPVDRFRESDLKLLGDMIDAEQGIAQCNKLIKKHGQVIGPGVSANPAVMLRNAHIRTIIQIQRALRLCPSARKQQDAADLQARTTASKKPWEA